MFIYNGNHWAGKGGIVEGQIGGDHGEEGIEIVLVRVKENSHGGSLFSVYCSRLQKRGLSRAEGRG